ncbi:MAG: sensor histidine kinase, partial [Terriglobales bacterium]
FRTRSSAGSGMVGLLKGFQLRQRMQEPFTREVGLMTQELRQAEGENANQERFWQSLTKTLLYVGIVVNIAITLLLAVFFSRGISSRLGILTDNAVRLAGKKELHERLSGTDEIARLDQVFHRMADSLRAAEREKQEFVSMISHDLRTPLTSLQGTLALIAKGSYGALSQLGQTRVAKAETSLERLINLINELLEIERLEAGMVRLECRNVKIQNVIEQSIESISAFSEQHQVSITAQPVDATLNADPDRLVQVLVNLLSNAVKFSPGESAVHVAVEESSGWLKISVRDEGRGIPPQSQQAVFDRFKQVQDSDAQQHSGAGLGLAISKSIVEAHHGEIGVISEVGKGSTFWFRLPLTEG